jgi:hypothetical protein
MTDITLRRHAAAFNVICVLVVFETAVFLSAALQHLGVPISLGFTLLSEPRILPAAIVEGSSGLLFFVCAIALLSSKDWAMPAAVGIHIYALAGVLLGILSLAMGFGPRTPTNDLYHMLMLLLIIPGLALLAGANSEDTESLIVAFFHWLIRITGAVQVVLGVLFWFTQKDGLIPDHILVGSALVLSLGILGVLAAQAGVDRRWTALAIAWGLIVVILGLTQTRILPGPAHWVIELLHLLIGMGAIGQGEGLAARVRQIKRRAF